MRNRILYYALKYQGDYRLITDAIVNHKPYRNIHYDGKYITIFDDAYPEVLLHLHYRPWILFYDGDLSLLSKESVAVIGSRMMSDYGRNCISFLDQYLSCEYGIVSGLAKGIDAQAHKQALQSGRKCIAVVGCGIDIAYPKENQYLYQQIKKEGLIISEYPNGTKPLKHHFPWRNRIIAALSKAVIVVEAKAHSGTMITVNEALALGIAIYCFPHEILDENGLGCNLLIAQGSNIIAQEQDVKEI